MARSRTERMTPARRRRPAPTAESLESRQLLSGDITLAGTETGAIANFAMRIEVADASDRDASSKVSAVSIDWGDGTPASAGWIAPIGVESIRAVDGPGGPIFGVPGGIYGNHAYATPGDYTVTVTAIEHAEGQDDQVLRATSHVSVASPVLTPTTGTFRDALAGQPYVGDIEDFGSNLLGKLSEWPLSATIDWGDGSAPTVGRLDDYQAYSFGQSIPTRPPGPRPVSVSGAHTYANPGTYTATITVNEGTDELARVPVTFRVWSEQGGPNPLVVTPNTPTAYADPVGAVGPQVISLVQAEDLSANAPGAMPWLDRLATLHATIDWGDGSAPTPGAVGGGLGLYPAVWTPGRFDIRGDHAYARAGDYPATITLSDESGHSTTATTTVHVADESIRLTPGHDEGAVGSLVGRDIVTGFDPAEIGGLKATIDWGDGSVPSTPGIDGTAIYGATPGGPDNFQVASTGHVYARPGVYTVHVTVTSPTGASASTDATILIGGFTGAAVPQFVSPGEAVGASPLAYVGRPGADVSEAGYTATIDWGDGSAPVPGTASAVTLPDEPWMTATPTGPRRVVAITAPPHTYAAAGAYPFSVTVTDPSGEMHTFQGVVNVGPTFRLVSAGTDPVRQTEPVAAMAPAGVASPATPPEHPGKKHHAGHPARTARHPKAKPTHSRVHAHPLAHAKRHAAGPRGPLG